MSEAPGWSFSGLTPAAPSPTKEKDVQSLPPPCFTTPVPQSALDVLKPATEKSFAQATDLKHITISPQRKLIAIATGEKQIECFRLNGTRAFWHKRSGYANILALSWLKHKDYLQVAWSDGKLELLETKTGKPARTLQLRAEEDVEDVSLLLLTTTFFRPHAQRPEQELESAGPNNEIQALVSLLHGSGSSPSLFPSAFAWFDIQEELPKLSALPVISEDRVVLRKGLADNFIKQDLLDAFVSESFSSSSDGTICALSIAVWSDGIVSFIDEGSDVLEGCFSVLSNKQNTAANGNKDDNQNMGQIKSPAIDQISHAWNSASSSHVFIADTSHGSEDALNTIEHPDTLLVKFGELDNHASYLKQLTFLLKRFQTLSNYIIQVIINIRTIYQGWRRVPGTWINAGNDMLKDSKYRQSLPQALYRFAVTGQMIEPLYEWVKEWIAPADSMQNYDRWRAAIHDGYTSILDAIHNCLLPAIDRAAIVQNRLKVLNRMADVRLLNVDQEVFARLSNTLDTLRLLGHATMSFAATESRQFDAFASWLQNTLHYANTEPDSATAKELTEKLANADFLQILPYLTGALDRSKLEEILASTSIDMVKMVAKGHQVWPTDSVADELIKLRDEVLPRGIQSTSQDDFLFQALQWRSGVEKVIDSVQEKFTHSIRKEQYSPLDQLSRVRDVRSERRTHNATPKNKTSVASMTKNTTEDMISIASMLAGTSGTVIISSTTNTNGTTQTLETLTAVLAEGNITTLCFADSNFLLVMLATQEETRIVKIPYYLPPTSRPDTASKQGLTWKRTATPVEKYHARSSDAFVPHSQRSEGSTSWKREYSAANIASMTMVAFEHKDGFVPASLIYEEGKLAVLDESGKRLKVYYDLDVVDERDLTMQGNPVLRHGETGGDYWAD